MDDLEEEIEDEEFISKDNEDYFVPMTEAERQQYENQSLRAMEDSY
jgi:hypothetical protein